MKIELHTAYKSGNGVVWQIGYPCGDNPALGLAWSPVGAVRSSFRLADGRRAMGGVPFRHATELDLVRTATKDETLILREAPFLPRSTQVRINVVKSWDHRDCIVTWVNALVGDTEAQLAEHDEQTGQMALVVVDFHHNRRRYPVRLLNLAHCKGPVPLHGIALLDAWPHWLELVDWVRKVTEDDVSDALADVNTDWPRFTPCVASHAPAALTVPIRKIQEIYSVKQWI